MIVEMEKRRSKGSFLSFFDWSGKSQKKLFCENPNLPVEISKQGKENVDNMPKSQLNRIKVEDNGANSSTTASCDFNCALSISSDEGCGTKAPGLVARLMGLDSLPAQTVSELSTTALYGSNSLGPPHCREGSLHARADYCPVDYTNMPLKLEKSSWGAMESKAQKGGNPAAIRRFQTEMLPPKSAKPIPVTHNKLLSPIKRPGYVPPTNAAQIMDAAAKIIEANPQQYMRSGMSSVGPSSVPSRILDLKEQLEAAQYESKLVDPCTANLVNGKPNEGSNNLHKGTTFKGSSDSEKKGSCHLASKGKSASLAIPSKANVQRRDTSTLNGKRGYMKQKEENEIKPNQLSRSQKKQIKDQAQVMQQRAFTGQNSNVLRQNNQKQNSITNKGKSTSKMESNKPTTQTCSSESSTGARKTTNKGAVIGNIAPKRSSTRAIDTQKEFTVSKRKSISQKKRYIGRDFHNEARGPDNVVNNYGNKSIKCNITNDGSTDQNAISMNESKDVISFTFTSPLRRSMPESQSSAEQVMGTSNRIDVNAHGHSDKLYPTKLSLSLPGLDIIGGDTLSVLLEKKLKELTSRIIPPQCTLASEESSAGFSLEDKLQSLVSTTAREQDRSFHPDLLTNKLESVHDNGCSSIDNLVLTMNQQLQTAEPMEEPSCSSSSSESGKDLGCQNSRAITVFENPSVSESYLDSEDSTHGSTGYSSVQDEEVSKFSPINESISLENGIKWSEQSSSTVAGGNMAIKQLSGMSNVVDFRRSTRSMELEYVKDILSNAELMAEEFVIGQTNKVIMPSLFDLLENQSNGAENYKEYSKLERKVIFDIVSECLELRCRQAFVGSCKAWHGWEASVQRKSWLAEELYKEILGFRSMEEEVMVDELVSKDMSIGWGRWLDFDIEAFEEGLDVELDIMTNLINELVSELKLV